MRANNFTVEEVDTKELFTVKSRFQIPNELQSCHTAIVDGYIIEGHVPAPEVERLLAERPDIAGLAVAGMPVGSPGMEVDGQPNMAFDVIAFDKSGNTEIFASYNK